MAAVHLSSCHEDVGDQGESPMLSPSALILISLACGVICYFVARERGAKTIHWTFLGVLFGPLAVLFVFFSKPDVGK